MKLMIILHGKSSIMMYYGGYSLTYLNIYVIYTHTMITDRL